MIRHAAAIAALLLLTAPSVRAQVPPQTGVFKVGAAPANVHKAPTTASPVIGHAARGASLDVTRELGSWVKVVWPSGPDGVGYVHVSTGSIARAATSGGQRAAAESPRSTNAASAQAQPTPVSTPARSARNETVPPRPMSRTSAPPAAHTLGVGGLVGGSTFEVGATGRGWSAAHLGLQLELSRALIGDEPRRVTSVDVSPSVLYAFGDRVSDYWWVRPYVGAGPTIVRQSLAAVLPGDAIGETRIGFQAFGGGEVTFAGAPRFALSVDVGGRWGPAPVVGVDPGALRISLSGRWYLR